MGFSLIQRAQISPETNRPALTTSETMAARYQPLSPLSPPLPPIPPPTPTLPTFQFPAAVTHNLSVVVEEEEGGGNRRWRRRRQRVRSGCHRFRSRESGTIRLRGDLRPLDKADSQPLLRRGRFLEQEAQLQRCQWRGQQRVRGLLHFPHGNLTPEIWRRQRSDSPNPRHDDDAAEEEESGSLPRPGGARRCPRGGHPPGPDFRHGASSSAANESAAN